MAFLAGHSSPECHFTLESAVALSVVWHFFLLDFIRRRKDSCPSLGLMMNINKSVLRSCPKINVDQLGTSGETVEFSQFLKKARSDLYFFDYYKVGNIFEQILDI